jgi:predicted dehydrogenase
MDRFRNWRWYKKFSGGPIADLGSHQIDIFCWFLKANPSSVYASAGSDYASLYKDREWYDNIMTIYEFPTPSGTVRGFYEVLNSTSFGGYYEVFEGENGSIEISEDVTHGAMFPEPAAPRQDWQDMAQTVQKEGKEAILLDIGKTLGAHGESAKQIKEFNENMSKPPHLLHLENFFDAIHGSTKLTCPPDIAFETCVAVLGANDSVASGGKVSFQPEQFKV